MFSKLCPRSAMLSLSASVVGSSGVTLHKVSKAGLVLNVGDVSKSIRDLLWVMYPGSESDPSRVMCVCASGNSKWISPMGGRGCGD